MSTDERSGDGDGSGLPPTGELPATGSAPAGDQVGAPATYFYERGQVVGAYTLRKPLGRGGFGEVWRAERQRPHMTAAVKLIRRDRVDRSNLARFSAECQALALLDHPHIARIHDAGVTDDGVPYLAMDYVHGVPMQEFCDREKLDVAGRLELMAKVCDAVHHAHTQGLIHRDLKPDNVLVGIHESGDPDPRIVDFGIAKAVNKNVRLSDMTITQDLNVTIGTPSYMSPEQLESTQAGVDTRTDIFALGVMLYELLAGVLPLEARTGGIEELYQLVRADRPEPAARFAALGADERRDIAYRRGELTAQALDRLLRTRLRHLPMKALRPERNRRFSSAAAMAQDIRHYLRGEDYAEAAAEPRLDRLARSVRRNRLAYASGALVFLLLVGGVVSTTVGLRRALAAEAAAGAEAERAVLAEAVATARADELAEVTAFQASQLGSIEASVMGSRMREDLVYEAERAWARAGLSASEQAERRAALDGLLDGLNLTNLALTTLDRNFFDQTLRAIDERFATQPLLRATLLQTFGTTMRDLGLAERAAVPLREAVEIRRAVLGADDPMTLLSVNNLASVLWVTGEQEEAAALLRDALPRAEGALGAEHATTLAILSNLGALAEAQGEYAEAERLHRLVLEARERTLGRDHPGTLDAVGNVGATLLARGRAADAEPYYRRALDGRRRALGDGHPLTLVAVNNMGYLLHARGEAAQAERYFAEALEGRRRVLGDDHPETLTTVANMGGVLRALGRIDEAQRYYAEALEGRRRVLGSDHPDTLAAINNMGVLLFQSRGDAAGAEPYFAEALERRRRVLGEDHPATLGSMTNAGQLLHRLGRTDEAVRLLRDALEGYRRSLGAEHPSTITGGMNLGGVLRAAGDVRGALPVFRDALDGARRGYGDRHATTLSLMHSVADALAISGDLDGALPLFRDALDGRRAVLGPSHASTIATLQALSQLHLAREDLESAEGVLRELAARLAEAQPENRVQRGNVATGLGLLLQRSGRPGEAEPFMRGAVEHLRAALGDGHPGTVTAINNHGAVLIALGRHAEAVLALREGEAAARAIWVADASGRLPMYLSRLGEALFGAGMLGEAEPVLLEVFGLESERSGEAAGATAARLAELYEAWAIAEPGSGHEDRAAAWRARAVGG